ncbi:MAG: XTP/dITP diphosphohydrolase [Verrucomicrobiota bacterium]
MMSLLIATRNSHKTREFEEILGRDFSVTDLSQYPQIPETIESGKTFAENARLKAVAVAQLFPGFVLADDSGLEVDALNGAPGIFSARYAGRNATDRDNVEKLLNQLRRLGRKEDWNARFRCALALARDGHLTETFLGTVEGSIVAPPRGTHGFGYDPVFVPKELDQTFGELPQETKNRLSHRANAIRQMKEFLKAAPR